MIVQIMNSIIRDSLKPDATICVTNRSIQSLAITVQTSNLLRLIALIILNTRTIIILFCPFI